MTHKLLMLIFLNFWLLGPKCPSDSNDMRFKELKELSKRAFESFGLGYQELSKTLNNDEKELIEELTKYITRNDDEEYLRHTKLSSAKSLYQAMGLFINKVEESVLLKQKPTVYFIFNSSGWSITEFIVMDLILSRTDIHAVVDIINPVFRLNYIGQFSALKATNVTNVLFDYLSEKYPGRLIAYNLRSSNLSNSPNEEQSLANIFDEDSSIASDYYRDHLTMTSNWAKIVALADFDPVSTGNFRKIKFLLKEYPRQAAGWIRGPFELVSVSLFRSKIHH